VLCLCRLISKIIKWQFFFILKYISDRDGASRRERENTTIVLAGFVEQLNRDEDLIGFLRRAGHRNDAYVQGIIGPYPQDQ